MSVPPVAGRTEAKMRRQERPNHKETRDKDDARGQEVKEAEAMLGRAAEMADDEAGKDQAKVREEGGEEEDELAGCMPPVTYGGEGIRPR